MSKSWIVILMLLGCATVPEPCPQVCELPQGTCPAATHDYVEHMLYDDGKGCWAKTAACYPKGTPPECVPADCYFEQSLACDLQK